jgi:hypothetical protein
MPGIAELFVSAASCGGAEARASCARRALFPSLPRRPRATGSLPRKPRALATGRAKEARPESLICRREAERRTVL